MRADFVLTLLGGMAVVVEGQIENRFREHEFAEIIESVLPGIGAVLGAGFLAAAAITPSPKAASGPAEPAPPPARLRVRMRSGPGAR